MKSIKDIEYICSAENFLKVKRALNEIGLKLSECEYKLFLDYLYDYIISFDASYRNTYTSLGIFESCNKAVKLAEQEV